MSDMSDKTVVITGGNSGIGKEAAVTLASMGAHVVITARSAAKGDAALADVRSRARSGSVELASLDLASFKSIHACGADLLSRLPRIDVLLNNAGIVSTRRQETQDGFELTFGVNHLGHFLLTNLLLDRIRESAPARVITVASGAHRSVRRGLDFDDLQSTRRYGAMNAYARSKLANILFSNELARRLSGTGVSSNALHPGFVASNFAREGDAGRLGEITTTLLRPLAITPEKGARTSVYLASSPEVEGVTGRYFFKCCPTRTTAAADDESAALRLWEESEKLVAGAGG